jgi:hypothetical protein
LPEVSEFRWKEGLFVVCFGSDFDVLMIANNLANAKLTFSLFA